MANYCQNCNTELQTRSKFCRMCGTPIAIAPTVNYANTTAGERINRRDEISIPKTERVADKVKLLDMDSRSGKSPDLSHPPTAKTEPALLRSYNSARANQIDQSQPLAPATHAIVGMFQQAGFNLRVGAFMLDLLAVMLIILVSAVIASSLPQQLARTVQLGGFLFSLVFYVINLFLIAGLTGQTLGKKMIGIQIVGSDQKRVTFKQVLIRHLFGYPISLLVFALGFLWLLWDRKQQGWHDKIARTLVVKKSLKW
ncbi:MAG: RDD family protein [Blastocatellia bacterium]|nr:RDD family protein [Blastocatellia bacterium]